jgi:hypothetical protein
LNDSASFAEQCSYEQGLSEHALLALHRSHKPLDFPVPLGFFALCVHGASRAEYERDLIERLPKKVLDLTATGAPAPDTISRLGNLVVVNIATAKQDISLSNAVLSLLADHPNFMKGAEVVVTAYPSDGAFFDLNPVYKALRVHPSAPKSGTLGGRATAGSMGKSPITGEQQEHLEYVVPLLASAVNE